MTPTRNRCFTIVALLLAATANPASATNPVDAEKQKVLENMIKEVRRCWTMPPGLAGVSVMVGVKFNRDGSIRNKPVLLGPQEGASYREASQISLQAIV
ncbi:hypothetical protein CQ057_22700 [Ochrobactrum sp. MYb49]|nr:hypothetical protein CQ057_22700 [Ochrobactrum sp. MYb49]